MMAATEDSNDKLWNQSVCSKSWIEMVEEEEEVLTRTNGSIVEHNSPLLRDSTNTKHENRIKEEPVEDESACDITLSTETKDIKIQPSEVLPNFSVSHVKNTVSNDSVKENASANNQTKEPQKDFLQEDLSLTSHLNGFQLVSPCKADHKTPTKTPSKSTISHYLSQSDRSERNSSPSHITKRKLQTDEPQGAVTDEMLMPSPSKIRRQNTPKQEPCNLNLRNLRTPNTKFTPNNRKRSRELTPTQRSSEKKTPRELETDPEVLARRQKQIEYGRNTIGYERYRQLVPKESRTRMHPRTPPLHLKFSRRAWDGLIKVWRQRLHFWDPPSEGGGNPECLEYASDMSDASSTDGSLPNTPIQDRKRQCWLRNHKVSHSGKTADEDDEDQGCTPLPPED